MKNRVFGVFVLFLTFATVFAQQKFVDTNMIDSCANAFIALNAPEPSYSILSEENITMNSGKQIILVKLNPKGFVLISTDSLRPVWAFSFENNFDTPLDKLGITETLLGDISYQKPEIKQKKHLRQQEIRGPFVQTLWGQVNCYDKNNHLINVTNYYTPNNYAAGCVAISMSTLLHFYQWPKSGTGSYTDNDNSGSSTGSYSVDFSNTTYDWSDMLNRYRYKSPTLTQRQAAGKLAFQVAVALSMDFERNGSTSNVNRIPSAGKNYFRFDGVDRSPSSNVFWPMLDSNIAHGIPVIFAIKASNGAGHSIICDGLKIDDNGDYYYHLNMGWWGDSNGWYRIRDTWNSGGYTSITDAVFYFLPIPKLSTPYVKSDDNKVSIRWRYPAKARVEAFELQEKTDDGAWFSMDNTIQDTFYTVDIHPDQQQYFRLRAKVAERWPFDDWSNIEKISMDASGMNDISENKPITIFPNPVSDKLNIQFGTKILSARIEIYDINGKELACKNIKDEKSATTSFDVQSIKKGIYFVRIFEGPNRIKTLKFIKQ